MAIVNLETGQGRKDMFDKADLSGGSSQRGASLGAGDVIDMSGNLRAAEQVGAHESDPCVRRGRDEAKTNQGAGQEANAVDFDRPGNGALLSITVPSHVRVILDSK